MVATAGLSLGEYTALVFAGAMTFEDGLKVVQARGQAMQAAAEATPSGMVSVLGLEMPDVEVLVVGSPLGRDARIANYLCPGNTVVSGAIAAIERVEQIAADKGGIRTVRLRRGRGVPHRPDETGRRAVGRGAGRYPHSARRACRSGRTSTPSRTPTRPRSATARETGVSPVRWEETMRGLLADGVERFYEIGPGRVLAGLLKRVNRKADFRNISA